MADFEWALRLQPPRHRHTRLLPGISSASLWDILGMLRVQSRSIPDDCPNPIQTYRNVPRLDSLSPSCPEAVTLPTSFTSFLLLSPLPSSLSLGLTQPSGGFVVVSSRQRQSRSIPVVDTTYVGGIVNWYCLRLSPGSCVPSNASLDLVKQQAGFFLSGWIHVSAMFSRQNDRVGGSQQSPRDIKGVARSPFYRFLPRSL